MEKIQTPNKEFHLLMNQTGELIETKVELVRLKTIRTASDMLSGIAAKATYFLFLLIGYVVLNIGLSILIGNWLDELYIGFLIVAAVNFITGLVFFKQSDVIRRMVSGRFLNAIMKKYAA